MSNSESERRAARVADLQRQVQSGGYQVDTDKVAAALVEEQLSQQASEADAQSQADRKQRKSPRAARRARSGG